MTLKHSNHPQMTLKHTLNTLKSNYRLQVWQCRGCFFRTTTWTVLHISIIHWDATSSRNRTNVVHIHEAWCWGACRFNCLNSKQNKKWETQKKGRSYHRDKLKYIFILSQAQQLDWQAAENTWKFIYSWDCIWSYQWDLRGFISKYV